MRTKRSTPGTPLVELIYFAGRPLMEAGRGSVRTALERAGRPPEWQEWDQTAPGAPAHVHGLASPTILVAGQDVSGVTLRTTGLTCRADGIPDPDVIVAALAGKLRSNVPSNKPAGAGVRRPSLRQA
jgi:hypothetical protein